MADVRLPPLGETVEQGTITNWYKQVGDWVALDEPLYEVETDKVVTDVPSPAAGYVVSLAVAVGETLVIGGLLGVISADPVATVESETVQPVTVVGHETPFPDPPAVARPDAASPHLPPRQDPRVQSPLVRRLIAEHDLDLQALDGNGHGGRITRLDVERALEARRSATRVAESNSTALTTQAGHALLHSADDEIVPFSTIRRITAEHMVRSKATSAHTLTIVQVDFERIARLRKEVGGDFRASEGFSLTYLPFIVHATVDALREFPRLNASVGTDEIVIHKSVDLGIAVALDMDGLVVPVIRNADAMRLPAIASALNDVAERARSKRLRTDDLRGGSFTITNPGSYGTYAGAAIINQPQMAIMNTDGISKEPVVVERPGEPDSIAIHHVGRLSLSWDHRGIDGLYAAAFLDTVRTHLQSRDWSQELKQ